MDLAIIQFIKQILLPPSGIILFFTIALVLYSLRRKSAKLFFLVAYFSLLLLCMPLVSEKLMQSIEIYPPIKIEDINKGKFQAIVVLGGGVDSSAEEYGEETVSIGSLQRIRYAARLHRLTHLPIVTTGGITRYHDNPEGLIMAKVLREEYQIKNVMIENKSKNTAENAKLTAELLNHHDIKKVLLVTHAWHMRRAVMAFENAGIDVTPAPTEFSGGDFNWDFQKLIASTQALGNSVIALHEIIGYMWYKIRY